MNSAKILSYLLTFDNNHFETVHIFWQMVDIQFLYKTPHKIFTLQSVQLTQHSLSQTHTCRHTRTLESIWRLIGGVEGWAECRRGTTREKGRRISARRTVKWLKWFGNTHIFPSLKLCVCSERLKHQINLNYPPNGLTCRPRCLSQSPLNF